METDFTPLVQAIVALLAVMITTITPFIANAVLQWARLRWAEFEQNQPAWLSGMIEQAARIAVTAVEQEYKNTVQPSVEERKQAAMEIALRYLNTIGINTEILDVAALDAAIESVIAIDLNGALDTVFLLEEPVTE